MCSRGTHPTTILLHLSEMLHLMMPQRHPGSCLGPCDLSFSLREVFILKLNLPLLIIRVACSNSFLIASSNTCDYAEFLAVSCTDKIVMIIKNNIDYYINYF